MTPLVCALLSRVFVGCPSLDLFCGMASALWVEMLLCWEPWSTTRRVRKVARRGCKTCLRVPEQMSSESVLHQCKPRVHRCTLGLHGCRTKLLARSPYTLLHPLLTTCRTFLPFDQFPKKPASQALTRALRCEFSLLRSLADVPFRPLGWVTLSNVKFIMPINSLRMFWCKRWGSFPKRNKATWRRCNRLCNSVFLSTTLSVKWSEISSIFGRICVVLADLFSDFSWS